MGQQDEWDEFRVSGYNPNNPRLSQHSTTAPPIPYPVLSSPLSPARQLKSANANFKKGIKRDKSHYRELKDEAHWDDWKHSTLATVTAHGCELIMDPVYKPTIEDELGLFVKMQKFMYYVFIKTLKTSKGQNFVHAHEATADAQAVWRDYSSYMRTSTRADMELEDLLYLITSARPV